MSPVRELRIPATPEHVREARDFAVDQARRAPWIDDRRLDDLRLVVSEVVTNAVRAQRARGEDATIVVTCRLEGDAFELAVSDRGGGFDAPVDPVLPAPESLHRGGLGLSIVSILADEARYVRTDSGTEVRLVLHAHPRGGAE